MTSPLLTVRRRAPVRRVAGFSWEGPLTTNQTSGTYYYSARNFKRVDANPNAGAITNTGAGTARHIFIGCRFWTNTHVLKSLAAAGFEFYYCVALGENPNVDGQPMGCFIEGPVNWLIVENCKSTNLGGIRLVGSDMLYNRVRFNTWNNITGALSNGTGLPGLAGFRAEPQDLQPDYVKWMTMWQGNGITCDANGDGKGTGGTLRSEIAYNRVVNLPGQSRCADHISLFGSGGVSGAPLWIHHNLLWGSFTLSYASVVCVGRGILMETPGAKGRYIDVEDNTICAIPGAINLYRGHDDVNIRRNRALYSRKALGVTLPTYNVPFNADASNTGTNQKWRDNTYRWYSQSFDALTTPFVQNAVNSGNDSGLGWAEDAADCTEADEIAAIAAWDAWAASQGLVIGNTTPAW